MFEPGLRRRTDTYRHRKTSYQLCGRSVLAPPSGWQKRAAAPQPVESIWGTPGRRYFDTICALSFLVGRNRRTGSRLACRPRLADSDLVAMHGPGTSVAVRRALGKRAGAAQIWFPAPDRPCLTLSCCVDLRPAPRQRSTLLYPPRLCTPTSASDTLVTSARAPGGTLTNRLASGQPVPGYHRFYQVLFSVINHDDLIYEWRARRE